MKFKCSHHELPYESLAESKMDLFCHQFHVDNFWPTESKRIYNIIKSSGRKEHKKKPFVMIAK